VKKRAPSDARCAAAVQRAAVLCGVPWLADGGARHYTAQHKAIHHATQSVFVGVVVVVVAVLCARVSWYVPVVRPSAAASHDLSINCTRPTSHNSPPPPTAISHAFLLSFSHCSLIWHLVLLTGGARSQLTTW